MSVQIDLLSRRLAILDLKNQCLENQMAQLHMLRFCKCRAPSPG
jgi:hypothetical protein